MEPAVEPAVEPGPEPELAEPGPGLAEPEAEAEAPVGWFHRPASMTSSMRFYQRTKPTL